MHHGLNVLGILGFIIIGNKKKIEETNDQTKTYFIFDHLDTKTN